jgi:H+-transporting ATPase
MKGAPQVVLALCETTPEIEEQVRFAVQSLADRGYRALGVAILDGTSHFTYLGLLSLFDPPR